MTTRAKLTLCAALATALAALCLSPLFQDPFALAPHGLLLIAVTAGAGAGLRALPLPRALVPPLQLLVVLYVLMLTTVQSSMSFGVLPGPGALDAVSTLLSSGGDDIQAYAIPAPASDGLRLIVVGSVALVAVLVDTLAVTYRRAAAAGLPLLALYSVSGGLADSPGGMWLWFLFGAAGFLALLYTEGQDRLTRWGRVFHGAGRSATALSNGGRRIGVIALAAAVLVPVFAPAVGPGLFGGLGGHDGAGGGSGSGKGDERSLNLVVALTANLRSNDDTPLLSFSTDAPDADQLYLRIAALSEFNGQEWLPGQQSPQALPTTMPAPEGLAPNLPTTSVRTKVTVSEQLSTAWLPMPYPMSWLELPNTADWRFDPQGRTVSGINGQKSKGLTYSVGSVDVNATAAQLRSAGPAPDDIAKRYLDLPANLPSVVADTARDVTRGKDTPYDRAVALQQYFTSGGFTYNTKIDARTGPDAIAKFLQDKEGFCVHFAATMAAMSRSLGIPARVAIGFTPGTGNGTDRVVRSSNYHAWPELYFSGYGWMRFEPTPNRGSTPLYSVQQAAPTNTPSAAPSSAAPTGQPSAQPSSSSSCPPQQQHRIGDCADEAALTVHRDTAAPWWRSWPALLTAAAVLLLLAALAFPMLWRTRLRRRRLGAGRHLAGADGPRLTDQQVLAAWAELVDSAWDLGIPPDEARTPRGAARRLAEDARLDPDAAAAAGRVALATERVMYARESDAPAHLGGDVRTARAALLVRATRARRLRALLLPASAVRLWWRAQDRAAARRERTAERVAALRAAVAGPFRRLGRNGGSGKDAGNGKDGGNGKSGGNANG
ncbi:transglutaminaseTgpA domain-containing protein [Kitasatospora sp. NPDC088783]|uniref:transglutaminase family protein n=1 Tax=Kitasatospora sp. NPDC088783 TaxID=3364077 RepID=UPI0038145007